jgi:hypothetical protein
MASAAPMRQKSTSEVPGQSCRALPADQSSKSAIMYGPAARSKMAFDYEIDERESCNNVFGL